MIRLLVLLALLTAGVAAVGDAIVVADAVIEVYHNREKLRGFEFDYEPQVLRHFTAKLKPL